ncbi:tetrahydromethanopterin S-methyltransferase subunit F [Methanocalculus chunghsingensis]|uniref:Tetrahydromethanopterin S-methyltransferase subunit F n=1 Tax=Methanocalculus chunghsingensis TaxID=156457 RepID=A0A8J7WAF9_9EURY|nr:MULTISPECIES: tetrahydromethanopterin S-methyltransferase subunit F [Methanocalculus]MBR1369347.1 tetrahydromethanopterin S-methyltransferase subunit F [Methanocalculus chunghsingensis]MCP1714191.1 tetrahydromethanopterin S-methyltransferase subunit F [Methanocalculus alkaliphilus]
MAGSSIRMNAIDKMVENIRYKAQIIARTNKLESGIMSAGIPGFIIGLMLALVVVMVPVLVL